LIPNQSKAIKIIICVLLVAITASVYWQVNNYPFIYTYDDQHYVTKNDHVLQGMTIQNIIWSFTATEAGFWHPLTWLSLLLDRQLYGLNAGGYHLTNLFLHLINTILLFLLLNRMTGALWRSAFVAALFALHPLHVEVVALVSQRKDVLCTVFWLLTTLAYVSYSKDETPKVWRYLLVVLFFIMGLMAKPMLVTLPFVFLLMDYWPLNRIHFEIRDNEKRWYKKIKWVVDKGNHTITFLLLEKAPFILISFFVSWLTLFTEKKVAAVVKWTDLTLSARIGNAFVSYIEYISKMIVPVRLSVFYPHPMNIPLWKVIFCLALIIVISIVVVYYIRKRPYLSFGWFWYLGTLVPVIGIIQVGAHAMADRYTYIPLTGLFIILAWGGADLAKRWFQGKVLLSALSIIIVMVMTMLTFFQIRHWKDDWHLFAHAASVTENNYMAINNLAVLLMEKKEYQQAYVFAAEALKIHPRLAAANFNMGNILLKLGDQKKALLYLREALRLDPSSVVAMVSLGDFYFKTGAVDDAIAMYEKALVLQPENSAVHNNLGVAYAVKGQNDQAIFHFKKALMIDPDHSDARNNLNRITSQSK